MAESASTSPKPRILIADDSKVVIVTATKILKNHFELVKAADGLEAWEKLNADSNIQVVVTDLGMPNLDGYELIQKIRQAELEEIRDLPIMVITGNSEDGTVKQKVLELGATDFVTKPFAGPEFVARLQAHANYRSDRTALQKNTHVDLLTGTLNRKALLDKLQEDLSFITRHKQSLVVVLFEIDNHKGFAESAGQAAADKVIQGTAKILSSAIRREDCFGRYGAATFMTILPMAKIDGVVMLVKRLCQHIRSSTFKNGNESHQFTLSAGIASLPKGCPSDAPTILSTAEHALDNARALGSGEFQLLKLDSHQPDEMAEDISIDDLLDIISAKQRPLNSSELATAERRLAPLVALFSDTQKQRLLN